MWVAAQFTPEEIAERDAGAKRVRELWRAAGFPINIPHYDVGGTVETTGLAVVHAGEEIIPSAQAPRSESAAAAEIAAHEAAFPAGSPPLACQLRRRAISPSAGRSTTRSASSPSRTRRR